MAKILGASLENSIPKPSKQDMDYETEGHLKTLGEAADIMNNPAKLKRVHKLAGRKHKAVMGLIAPAIAPPKVKTLADLKAKANSDLTAEPDEDDME